MNSFFLPHETFLSLTATVTLPAANINDSIQF